MTTGSAEPEPADTIRSGTEWFETFRAEGQLRLRVVLASAFGAELGEESAADAVAYAWEHRDRLALMANPLGYLFRVGQSAARRHRRRWRPISLPAVSSSYEDRADPDLPRALAQLTERQRVAVVLVHVSGWTLDETAIAMDLSISTVRTHVARALARLEQLLKENN